MTHYLGLGDDGSMHWWQSAGGEELTRLCDDVTAVDVELYARDKHAARATCEACKEAKVRL